MTVESRSAKPDNAQVVVRGDDEPDFPDGFGGKLVVATSNGVFIGTRPPGEGATMIRVADADAAADLKDVGNEVWDGEIDVAGGRIKVTDVFGELILDWPNEMAERVRVRVATDDPKSPSDVVILLG